MTAASQHEVELRKALGRVNTFVAGGSRPVLISRAVLGGLLLVISLFLWVARLVVMTQ